MPASGHRRGAIAFIDKPYPAPEHPVHGLVFGAHKALGTAVGRSSALINMLIPTALPVAGLLCIELFPRSSAIDAFLPLALGIAGGALIVISKSPSFSSGHWAPFGASGSSRWARVAYRSGYTLLFLGVFESMVLLAAIR